MKRLIALLLILFLLPLNALAEERILVDRTDNLTEEYVFPEGTPVLEVVFPRIYSSDCAIIRFGNEVMMIDASTSNPTMVGRIRTAMDSMGVDHIDTAFNSHPHDDHLDGFPFVQEYAPISRFVTAFAPDFNGRMKTLTAFAAANDIPVLQVADGDVLTLGENGEVTMTVIQRWNNPKWGANDLSAMLLIRYGERTILFAGDVEHKAEQAMLNTPPACGLKADIIKYPHHGQQPLVDGFFEAVSPELAIMTGAFEVMDNGKKCLDRHGVPYLLSFRGLTRLRTDGQTWVVDYLHEENPDNATSINPQYATTTDLL